MLELRLMKMKTTEKPSPWVVITIALLLNEPIFSHVPFVREHKSNRESLDTAPRIIRSINSLKTTAFPALITTEL